jgi:hypothetical protein
MASGPEGEGEEEEEETTKVKLKAGLHRGEESSCLQCVGVQELGLAQERTPATQSSTRRSADVHWRLKATVT